MAGESYIELRDFFSGARLGIITGATGSGAAAQNGFLRLTTIRQVNAPGSIRVELPGDHPLVATLPDKTQVVHWRRDAAKGIDWYREHVGLFRDIQYASKSGQRRWVLTCPGLPSILGWYDVAWDAGTTNRTAWTSEKGETIMKTLTAYNAISATATAANGRDRDAPNYGVQNQADAAGGNTLDWTANRSKTLLEELQALALVAGGDFDLVYVSGTAREFRFYAGQRGTDKTALVTFAENLGNIDDVAYSKIRSGERTVAIVAGKGEGADRSITIRTGANYHASTNNIEGFVDAKDLNPDTSATRSARGDKRLDEWLARDTFGFNVVQTEGTFYGPSGTGSYTLGDLVTAVKPDGSSVSQQIYRVTLDWPANGQESVDVEMRTL